MLGKLKELAVTVLEKHPYGYALGLAIMESNAAFLPHEGDFYGMPLVSEKQNGLFLDVGANRGHSSLGFHKIMPGWRTLSIEANPIHAQRLESLKKRHEYFDYKIAAADAVSGEQVTIWTPKYGSLYCHSAAAISRDDAVRGIELSFPAQADGFEYEAYKTLTLRIDDLALAPDIVKMDIQGKELDALRGLDATIRKHKPAFLIECNLRDVGIIDFMRGHDYAPFLYDGTAGKMIPTQGANVQHSRNVFFLPRL